ncbi:MAG: hypothetical protein ABJZ55_17065 [Fuerstiella sp.]
MSAVFPIGLLFIAGIITVCIVATVRMKTVWPLAIFGSLLLVSVVFLSAYRVHTSSRQVTDTKVLRSLPQEKLLPARETWLSGNATSWNAIDTKQFRTNIFPSVASAANDLAKQVPTILKEMHGTANKLTKLKLQATCTSTVPQKGQGEFQKELLKLLPDTTFTLAETPDKTKKNTDDDAQPATVKIELNLKTVSSSPAAWNTDKNSENGTLSCVVHSIQGSRSISVDYIEKPWLEQLDQFSNAYPARGFAVGVSSTLCESAEAANQSAIQSLKAIETHTAINGIKAATPIDNSHVIDRFVQKLERPYGDVWREAVLVDYKSPQIERIRANMVADMATKIRAEQTHESQGRFHLLILIAVFAATALIGMALNLVTEGYLRGKIATTVTAFVVAAAIAFFIQMPW